MVDITQSLAARKLGAWQQTARAILMASLTGSLPTAMAAPPTITVAALSNTATTIASGVNVRADQNAGLFTYLGAVTRAHTIAGGNQFSGYTPIDYYMAGVTTRSAANGKMGGVMAVRFGYGGRYLDLMLLRMSNNVETTGYRIWVDGKVTAVTPRKDLTIGQHRRVNIDFGSYAPRELVVELDMFVEFGGVTREPNYNIWAIPSTTPRILGLSDSYFEGASGDGAGDFIQSCWMQATALLGLRDNFNASEAASGYLQKNAGSSNKTPRERLSTDVIPYDPKWVVLALGCNDQATQTAANVGVEAGLLVRALLDGLPNAGLTVLGPWRAPNLNPATTFFDAIRVATTSQPEHGGRLLYVDTLAENWQQIGGRIGAPSGEANSNVYIGPDGTHLVSGPGHDYMGTRIAEAVKRHCRIAAA